MLSSSPCGIKVVQKQVANAFGPARMIRLPLHDKQ